MRRFEVGGKGAGGGWANNLYKNFLHNDLDEIKFFQGKQ